MSASELQQVVAASVFFGSAAAVPRTLCRVALSVADVTPDEAGLRKLAAAGSWVAVGALAERLESQALDDTTRLPTEASLKFTVVRVQTCLRLQQPESAKRIFDVLGNFQESRFFVTVSTPTGQATRRSVVPFSLLFLKAQLPALLPSPTTSATSQSGGSSNIGGLQEAQLHLYDLLAHCEAQQSAPFTTSAERFTWRHRGKRVRRALVANHFELQQFGTALTMMNELAETETNDMAHMFAMQQLGCMCLRCGNSFLAAEVFRTIEKLPLESSGADAASSVNDDTLARLKDVKAAIVAVNQALLLAFHGYFAEACVGLRNVLSGIPAPVPVENPSRSSGASGTTTKHLAGGDTDAALAFLRRCAANSLVACVPFLHRNDAPEVVPGAPASLNPSIPIPSVSVSAASMRRVDKDNTAAAEPECDEADHPLAPVKPKPVSPPPPALATGPVGIPRTMLSSLIQFLEDHARADPVGFLAMDATLLNLARLYDLEGQTGPEAGSAAGPAGTRHDVLEALVEMFRGNKDACVRWRK